MLQFACDVVKDTGKEEYLLPFIYIGLDRILLACITSSLNQENTLLLQGSGSMRNILECLLLPNAIAFHTVGLRTEPLPKQYKNAIISADITGNGRSSAHLSKNSLVTNYGMRTLCHMSYLLSLSINQSINQAFIAGSMAHKNTQKNKEERHTHTRTTTNY